MSLDPPLQHICVCSPQDILRTINIPSPPPPSIVVGEDAAVPELIGNPQDILPDITWLEKWLEITATPTIVPKIPPSACVISTPLLLPAWTDLLAGHPNQKLVKFFLDGISNGFRLGFDHTKFILKSAGRNLPAAVAHPEVVIEYLQHEISMKRVAGPFPVLHDVHISRFGVIPKSHQINKWRLILDLSFPKGRSVNDGIPKDLCSLHYITIDDAIQHIMTLGRGTLLAKVDIKSAFRLLPVHPADRYLLGMQWENELFIDTCLPFGLRSAPKLFNILADFLAWVLQQQGVSPVLHYLDDFLFIGPPASIACLQHLNHVKQVCHTLGVPLAVEKVEGPAAVLSFLGILLDTQQMEARLPEVKLQRLRATIAEWVGTKNATGRKITEWIGRKNATKREILSLVGQLQHVCKVVRYGRTFVARLYSTASKVKELDFYTRLNKAFKSDLCWWHTFLKDWNGVSLFKLADTASPAHATIQTDASGSWGCGAFFNNKWFQWQWPQEWQPINIMAKEMAPILLSCGAWGPHLTRLRVKFECDNSSVVAAIQKGSAKDDTTMHLLRCLFFFVAYYV